MKKVSEANYYAATTDLCTSSCNHPYLSYTVHFINNKWKMCSFCLDTVPLFEDHTGKTWPFKIFYVTGSWIQIILLVPPQIMVVILSLEWSCWGGPE